MEYTQPYIFKTRSPKVKLLNSNLSPHEWDFQKHLDDLRAQVPSTSNCIPWGSCTALQRFSFLGLWKCSTSAGSEYSPGGLLINLWSLGWSHSEDVNKALDWSFSGPISILCVKPHNGGGRGKLCIIGNSTNSWKLYKTFISAI